MKRFLIILAALAFFGCEAQTTNTNFSKDKSENMSYKIEKSDQEWQKELTPEQFRVLRQAGTERPFTGEYNMHFEDGVYKCAACDSPLFDSEAKFESHCGWPSFDKALSKETVVEKLDKSHGMVRTEILCANCGSHLGHLFNDGPTDTGMRYCINSVSLGFDDEEAEKKQEEKK